ncbi:MAG: hypothetical protein JXM73_20020 [Anaerolineae bacterium]|nr:hypothetical protein [Anaerolineae bacterium]
MTHGDRWPDVTYEQARAAYEAGQKLHLAGRVYLVRPILPKPGAAVKGRPVLWVTDEWTRGDHGMVLFPDGRVEVR